MYGTFICSSTQFCTYGFKYCTINPEAEIYITPIGAIDHVNNIIVIINSLTKILRIKKQHTIRRHFQNKVQRIIHIQHSQHSINPQHSIDSFVTFLRNYKCLSKSLQGLRDPRAMCCCYDMIPFHTSLAAFGYIPVACPEPRVWRFGLVADGASGLWIVVVVACHLFVSGAVSIFLCGLILTAEAESKDGHWLY